jgi:hypothetical protein
MALLAVFAGKVCHAMRADLCDLQAVGRGLPVLPKRTGHRSMAKSKERIALQKFPRQIDRSLQKAQVVTP